MAEFSKDQRVRIGELDARWAKWTLERFPGRTGGHMRQADLDLLEQAGLLEVTASHGERREYRIKSGAESLFWNPASRFDVLEAEYLAARELPMEEEPPRLFKLIEGGRTIRKGGHEVITSNRRRKVKVRD